MLFLLFLSIFCFLLQLFVIIQKKSHFLLFFFHLCFFFFKWMEIKINCARERLLTTKSSK